MLEDLLARFSDDHPAADNAWVNIERVDYTGEDVTLHLYCRGLGQATGGSDERWRIEARGAREACMSPAGAPSVLVVVAHPLLLPHTSRWTELYVGERPSDLKSLLGGLMLAHQVIVGSWLSPTAYINWEYCYPNEDLSAGGMGLLARGPRPLLEAYAKEAELAGMHPTLIGDHDPPLRFGSQRTLDLRLLLIGESYCVASSFQAYPVGCPGHAPHCRTGEA